MLCSAQNEGISLQKQFDQEIFLCGIRITRKSKAPPGYCERGEPSAMLLSFTAT